MHPLSQLLDFVGPGEAPISQTSRARRLFLAAFAFLAAIAFAAVWGIAAGSHGGHVAFDNVVKVPMLLIVSSLAALPASLILFRLTARSGSSTHLLVGHAAATFTATFVLALLAPIVLLYQYSSTWAGPAVAFVSAVIGVAVGAAILLRVLGKLLPSGARRGAFLPVGLLVVLQVAAILQLAAITTPVFPTRTTLGRGIDGIAHAEDSP